MKVLAAAVFAAALVNGVTAVNGALDSAANAIFQAADAPNRTPTKVVPLVTPAGERSGFAQITGDSKGLAHTGAVIEIRAGSPWQITAFIPVSHVASAQTAFNRVYGVYVTALVAP